MVGAAPVCPPERPRSGVSICKGYILTRKEGVSIRKEHAPSAKAAFLFIDNVCSHQNMFVHLPTDAPSWGDTGGHTGTAPTSIHQTPLPRNLLHFCPSASTSPVTFS